MKRFTKVSLLAVLVIMACGSVSDLAEQAREIEAPAAEDATNGDSGLESDPGVESDPGAGADLEAAYEISAINDFTDSFDQVNVLGLVTNTGSAILKFPMITVELVDSSGTVVASRQGAPAISEIRPGFSVPFQVPVFPDSGEWTDIQVSADFDVVDDPSAQPSYQEFELVSYTGEADGSGGYTVTGEINNTGDRGAEQIVIVVGLYSADGQLLGLGLASPEDYTIAAGGSSMFSAFTQQIAEGEVDRVELWAEAVFTVE